MSASPPSIRGCTISTRRSTGDSERSKRGEWRFSATIQGDGNRIVAETSSGTSFGVPLDISKLTFVAGLCRRESGEQVSPLVLEDNDKCVDDAESEIPRNPQRYAPLDNQRNLLLNPELHTSLLVVSPLCNKYTCVNDQ